MLAMLFTFYALGLFPDPIQCFSCVIGSNEVIVLLLRYLAEESSYHFLNTGHSFFQFLTWIVLTRCTVVQSPLNHTRANRTVLIGEIEAAAVTWQTTVA